MAEFDPKEFLKQYGSGAPGAGPPPSAASETTSAEPDEPGMLRSFAGGAVQGALFDPVEGIGQLIEHATGHNIPIPDSVRNWFNDYEKKYAESTSGMIGRGVGTVASLAIPGSAAAKVAGLVGKGTAAAGEGASALGRLARVIRTPPPAVQGLAGRARPGAGEAAKAFRKGKMLEEPAKAAETATPKKTWLPPAMKKKMTAGAAGGAAGGAVAPVDEEQGDYWKQKAGQVAGGALGGGVLGSPGGGQATTLGAIYAAADKFGWHPTSVGLALLAPTLYQLARHHSGLGGWDAAYHLADWGNKIVQRPGAGYAFGRAAAPFTAPAGEAAIDQFGEQ